MTQLLDAVDILINKVTMYRLVVYELCFLLGVALILSLFGVLPYNPIFLIYSVFFIFCVSWSVNKVFAFAFDAPSNPESVWITALILALLVTPPQVFFDQRYLPLAFWSAALAIASKYIFAIYKKHVFNPAAFGIALTSLTLGLSASWWVGTPVMSPFVLIAGLIVVRKIYRFDLWWAFISMFSIGMLYTTFMGQHDFVRTFNQSFLYTPVFFFAAIMLTEPLTMPPTRTLRILYGALVGLLFLPDVHIVSFYFTPEIALLVGNIFSYAVSPKRKIIMTLKGVVQLSHDVYEFVFTPNQPLTYKAGQYMEWTLAHKQVDLKGIRRYFTLASSPTEKEVRLGVKMYEPLSSFKHTLYSMNVGDTIIGSQLAGDFTLPDNTKQKLVFIAGGVGVTPFRSMTQYMLDTKERRDVTLLYINKTPADVIYTDVFTRAARELDMKTVYTYTNPDIQLPQGAVTKIDANIIRQEIPNYLDRIFYLSGPPKMVAAFKRMLRDIGVKQSRIKTDYFSGLA